MSINTKCLTLFKWNMLMNHQCCHVAHKLVNPCPEKCAVLTGEKLSNSPKKRPHIPDVCNAMGVRWINMVQLFRDQGWVFRH